MTTLDELIELTQKLTDERQSEVRDFARFLTEQQRRPKQKYLRMSWAGALREYRDQYTSVELQHKALDWWVEAALDGCSNAEAIRHDILRAGALTQRAAINPDESEPDRICPMDETAKP